MIKLKLSEIIEAESAFIKLDSISKDGNLEFKTTYKLGKLIKKIQPELKDFYEEKDKILKKYGTELTETKDGEITSTGQYEIVDRENFTKYINELLQIEVELTNVFPFTLDELDGIKGLSTEDILRLNTFVEDAPAVEEEKERKKIQLNLD